MDFDHVAIVAVGVFIPITLLSVAFSNDEKFRVGAKLAIKYGCIGPIELGILALVLAYSNDDPMFMALFSMLEFTMTLLSIVIQYYQIHHISINPDLASVIGPHD